MTTRREDLEAIERAMRAQDEAWSALQERVAQLGGQVLAVPSDALERIDAVSKTPAAPEFPGVRV